MVARYSYDSLSRLTREDNKKLGKTYVYEYDCGGNILSKKEFNFTLKSVEELESIKEYNYCYNSTRWKDQLVSYNGESFVYDELGNPTIYRNKTLTWSHGRRLDQFGDVKFEYNANGIRTQKGNIKYFLNGNKIIAQQDNENTIYFHYGTDGVVGFTHNGNEYTYKKNVQGDIIGIYDNTNTLICKYVYDAWGNCKCLILSNNGTFVDNSDNIWYNNICKLNPFRYRGYYFDIETKLYYLNSRYYDPELGRFINADAIDNVDEENVNGFNLYMYCSNNPINYIDDNGNKWWDPRTWNWKKIGQGVAATIGVVIAVAAVAVSVATAGLATVVSSMVAGAVIGGTVNAGFELGKQLYLGDGLDWKAIGLSFLGGAIAGSVSAIPGMGYGMTFLLGGTASVLGGMVTGSVNDGGSFIKAFLIGGIANVIAKGIGDKILAKKSGYIDSLGRKAKSLAVQQLQTSKEMLKGSMRNAFKNVTLPEITKLVVNSNLLIRLGIYSSLTSSLLSLFA